MAWGFAQAKSTSTSNYTAPISVTMTSTPTTGNVVIVAVSSPAGSSSQTLTVKDGNSVSVPVLTGGPYVNGTNVTAGLFAYTVPASPSSTFTLTDSVTGGSPSFQAMEFSGITTTVDGTIGHATGSTSPASATYSSSASNRLLVSFFGDWGAGITATVPSGYTAASANINTSSAADNMVGYKNSTGGSETASWTYSPTSGDQWVVVTVAFDLTSTTVVVPATPKMPYVTGVQRATLN